MNDGISGYNGRLGLHHQLEHLSGAAPQEERRANRPKASDKPPASPSFGPDLSNAESRMIDRYFPESEEMTLRLYGPDQKAESVNPNAVGSRLDLRG